MDPGQVAFTIIAMTGAGVICYGGIRAINAVANHYSGNSARALPESVEAELQDIRARLEESEQARERIAELEERLDFAERLLAQQREPGRIGSSGERP
ncbi:MAG TPA: hypothetical protein VG817_00555 [Gemmatimonadales bacterium]|nr:hypothetical protein [Gemmatimonadales bacterium]